jgi:hypothetical protein
MPLNFNGRYDENHTNIHQYSGLKESKCRLSIFEKKMTQQWLANLVTYHNLDRNRDY